MSEFVKESRKTRPDLPDCFTGEWTEVVIQPFNNSMAIKNEGWLQWGPEDCKRIPSWLYCLLGLIWPVIRLIYREPLVGQSTDY